MGLILGHGGLLGVILEWTIVGQNHRGRPRSQYTGQTEEDQELKRKASDRETWKSD